MKKINKNVIAIALLSLLFSGCSSLHQTNDLPNKDEESIFIEKLRKDMYDKGYNQAQHDLKNQIDLKYRKIIEEYREDFLKLELGKFAIKKGYITFPEMLIQNIDGTIIIDSLGCKVQKPLNTNEIIDFYTNSNSMIRSTDFSKNTTKNNDENNAIWISSNENNKMKTLNEVKNEVSLYLPKNYRTQEILKIYNLDFNTEDETYIVNFKNDKEKKEFCSITEICGKQ